MRTLDSIRAVVGLCTYPGFEFKVACDGTGGQEYPWLQIVCAQGIDTETGEPASWTGRKWKLSFHMTDTELVQTAWAAVQRALLHEASELFRFKGAALYDRHIDVHELAALAARNDSRDGRHDGMQG